MPLKKKILGFISISDKVKEFITLQTLEKDSFSYKGNDFFYLFIFILGVLDNESYH